MKCLDLTLGSPAENLACDEALLDACDQGSCGEVLRFWESPEYFVVVGYGNAVETEVNRAVCERKNIPILRRCTGGGTVVQGPGCLNYSVVLRIDENRPIHSITATNRFVMERNKEALESASGRPVTLRGHTDLAIGDQKFSGNAQRRRKNALLFHGSLLLHFELERIGELLPMPSKQPDYRHNRSHTGFLANLGVPSGSVKNALRQAWQALESAPPISHQAVALLVRDKYATTGWNFKF